MHLSFYARAQKLKATSLAERALFAAKPDLQSNEPSSERGSNSHSPTGNRTYPTLVDPVQTEPSALHPLPSSTSQSNEALLSASSSRDAPHHSDWQMHYVPPPL